MALMLLSSFVLGLDNGLGIKPQLGFNSWNSFETHVNESLMRMTIDAFVQLGLRDAGYEYVSVDDWWAAGRFANGTIFANETSFPSGMKALADYAHERKLKFGLVSVCSEPMRFLRMTIDCMCLDLNPSVLQQQSEDLWPKARQLWERNTGRGHVCFVGSRPA